MKILKFGGTSVGSAQRMKDVSKLIHNCNQDLVVLSAMSGTTNSLVEIADLLYKKKHEEAYKIIDRLSEKYAGVIDELYATPAYREQASAFIRMKMNDIRSFVKDHFTSLEERIILSQGELMSTTMMNLYFHETGVNTVILPALEYMRTDENAEPDTAYIKEKLVELLQNNPDAAFYITEGYICLNAKGEIDNLQRGGSDYTASLAGAALAAEEIQIWTDIDGMHNNDPRFVENTTPVRFLSFDEATELAYFGAKILHPTCILPAKVNNIPVRLLNSLQPESTGTTISNDLVKDRIKAVAAKENITAIKIKSGRMLLATGFLRKVFEIFETWHTPIDMVTTSEVGVSVTIDNPKYLDNIVGDLKKYGAVTIDRDMLIICVAGDLEWHNISFEANIINALKTIPIRMISYGGSNYNVSLLIRASDKKRALQALSENLFN